MKKILEMSHISKAFGGVKALTDVHLEVNEGEVHALLGENGAGKSTLMNILTGVLQADSGKITFLGKDYYTPTINQMEEAGIAFVHQELNVINDLTVVDNIFLTRELTGKFGIIDEKKEIQTTKELFDSLGVNINPYAMVRTLKTSEKQLLEICKALYTDAKLIILDEPTTSLSNEEIDSEMLGMIAELSTDKIRNVKKVGRAEQRTSSKMQYRIINFSCTYNGAKASGSLTVGYTMLGKYFEYVYAMADDASQQELDNFLDMIDSISAF